MNITTNYESMLVLKTIMITEGTFKRTEGSLELNVADPDGKLSVFVRGMAVFETEQENQMLIERNTLAIMFPYFRSYVSTLTTQPGMTPIVLPAMNIMAILAQKND